jgi:hypothetical protein
VHRQKPLCRHQQALLPKGAGRSCKQQRSTGITGPDPEEPSEATYTTPKVPAAASAVNAENQRTTTAQLTPQSERTPHPEAGPVVPVAQRCTFQRLADVTEAVLPSTEHSFRTCEQVQGDGTAALARRETERYSWQCRQPATCAMRVHTSAAGRKDKDHHAHRPVQLWTPRRCARWRQRRSNPAQRAET